MIPAIPHMVSDPLRSRENVQVALPLPVGDGPEEPLPLVALVVHVDVVETAGQRTPHDLVLLERLERLAEMAGDARNLAALAQDVVDVALLRGARVELALDAVKPGLQERRLREVRVACGIDGAELEAADARHAD